MSRSAFVDSSLSDFSDADECEQMDKENQQDDSDRDSPSATNNDEHQQRIFEQQQLQRQQFYTQQQRRDRRSAAQPTRRHSQPNAVFIHNDDSSPDDDGRPQSSPETTLMSHAHFQAQSASSTDSDSSSSGTGPDKLQAPYNGHSDWIDKPDEESLSPIHQSSASINSTITTDLAAYNYSAVNDAPDMMARTLLPADQLDDSMEVSQDAPMKSPEPVSEYLVDRIDQEKWPGVNGDYDNDGEWREWHEMTTAVNVYSGDIVNILPYVNISC